jgi:xanthine/uracil permease
MPASKKKKQQKGVSQENNLLAMQAVLLAIVAGVVLFGILKMVQFRDEVDSMIARELATSIHEAQPNK